MSLISILLYAIGVMTLMIGIVVFFGSSRTERKRTAWVLLSDIGAFIWAFGMASFLHLEPTSPNLDESVLNSAYGIYIGGLVAVAMILGYASWQYVLGKIATIINILLATFLSIMLVVDPGLLYHGYEILYAGNALHIVNSWFYWVYAFSMAVVLEDCPAHSTLVGIPAVNKAKEKKGE